MCVHLREAQVCDGRGLKRAYDLIAAHAAGTEFFQKLNGFSGCHTVTMPEAANRVTRES